MPANLAAGMVGLVVDEFSIVDGGLPDHYVATLSIRYERDQYAAALAVVHDFLKARYAHVVVSGHSGSRNGDQIKVWFWSTGRKS